MKFRSQKSHLGLGNGLLGKVSLKKANCSIKGPQGKLGHHCQGCGARRALGVFFARQEKLRFGRSRDKKIGRGAVLLNNVVVLGMSIVLGLLP